MITITEGDKFYIKTKYGGEVHGEVENAHERQVYDLVTKVVRREMYITTTNGVEYPITEDMKFYTQQISDDSAERLTTLLNQMKDDKQRHRAEALLRVEELRLNGAFTSENWTKIVNGDMKLADFKATDAEEDKPA